MKNLLNDILKFILGIVLFIMFFYCYFFLMGMMVVLLSIIGAKNFLIISGLLFIILVAIIVKLIKNRR